jgi:hypothetical protein
VTFETWTWIGTVQRSSGSASQLAVLSVFSVNVNPLPVA